MSSGLLGPLSSSLALSNRGHLVFPGSRLWAKDHVVAVPPVLACSHLHGVRPLTYIFTQGNLRDTTCRATHASSSAAAAANCSMLAPQHSAACTIRRCRVRNNIFAVSHQDTHVVLQYCPLFRTACTASTHVPVQAAGLTAARQVQQRSEAAHWPDPGPAAYGGEKRSTTGNCTLARCQQMTICRAH